MPSMAQLCFPKPTWPLCLRHHKHQSWCVSQFLCHRSHQFGCVSHCSCVIAHTSFGVLATVPAPAPASSPTPVLGCQSTPVSPPTPVLWCLQLLFITHANQGVSTMVPVSSPTPVLVCLQLPCAITHTNLSESVPVEYLQHHPVLGV